MPEPVRWTVKLPDGTFMCAQCEDHEFGRNFDYSAILRHYRETHREFYKSKWESEAMYEHLPQGAIKKWEPLP